MAGKLKRANELATLANKIDPGNIFIFIDQGVIYMQEGKMLQAQAMFKKAVDVMDVPIFNYLLGWSYYHNGQLKESIKHFETARLTDSIDIAIHIAYLSNIYYQLNQVELSEKHRNELLARQSNGEETINMPMAILSAVQGTKEETLEYLELAFEQREPNMSYLMNVDPLFTPLHEEPRFIAIRKKMGYYD
jgi:tetratricopeptide (TPR) repeat protein